MKKWKDQGGKIVGYFCSSFPEELIVAAGLLLIGGLLVINQQMNIGQFVAAEIIIILIIASVEKLIKSMDSIYDVRLTSILLCFSASFFDVCVTLCAATAVKSCRA